MERAEWATELKTLREETGRLRRVLDRLLDLTEAAHIHPGKDPVSDANWNRTVGKASGCGADSEGFAGFETVRLAEAETLKRASAKDFIILFKFL